MASTRLKNCPGEYKLQQIQNSSIYENRIHNDRIKNNQHVFPELGFNISHMHHSILGSNTIDVESQLYGIRATDLVHKKRYVQPKMYDFKTQSYFDRNKLILPKPLVIHQNQRPIIP